MNLSSSCKQRRIQPAQPEMRISVIIPVYNRPAKVQRAIGSVVAQTYSPEEIIVVDDHSTDSTSEVLSDIYTQYQNSMRVLWHRENRGVGAARNTGINAASAEWIAFLDSDDEWRPDKLQKQVRFHREHPELKISQCDELWIRDGERVNKRRIHQKEGGQIFKESLKLCLVSPSAVLMHQSLFEEIGDFDESFPVCEDYDLWLRILTEYAIGYLNEPLLTRYGGHEDQLSSRYWGMDRWRVRAMEKHLNTALPHEWKVALYQELIEKLQILYQGARKREKPEAGEYRRKISGYQHELQKMKESGETIDLH